MCCTRLVGNAGPKKLPSAHHHTTLSGCMFATKACVDNRKKFVKQQYVIHVSSQHGELGPLTAKLCWRVWGTPAKFNGFRALPSLLQRCRSPEANQSLYDVWPSPGLVNYMYIFGGSCPLTEFCPVQYSLYVPVLRSSILATLLHGTPAAGVSQTSRHGTRNGMTELSQRVPPIFGRAAITLGIGPHSSWWMCAFVVLGFVFPYQARRLA